MDAQVTAELESTPIASRFVRDYYQWDRMSEVKWDIVRNNLASAERILANPAKFPNADTESVAQTANELSIFLTLHLR